MKNIGIKIISFILCVMLFVAEISFMALFNISNGVTQQEVMNIVDHVDIKEELEEVDAYNQLKEEINAEVLDQLLESQEINQYVKGNAKAIYINSLYDGNMDYINSIELKEQINNKIDTLIEQNEVTLEQKNKIMSVLDEITQTIDDQIEEINNQNVIMEIIKTILNKKTANYILIGVIIISGIIMLINKSKAGYLWIGLPTLITGALFLTLTYALEGKLPETSIDIEIKAFVMRYLPTLVKTMKKTSIIMTIIGFMGCALYTILNFQERSTEDGKI